MFDKFSEKNIWVASTASTGSATVETDTGDGSFENPYSKIQTAIDNASAGTNIVLFSGIYNEKLIVQDICGTTDEPITICAFSKDGEEVISNSDWYFYSASDFVIKGIKFQKTANSAISLIGESQRNSIKDCEFEECGEASECAVFFGGSGGECNIIENCEFTAPKDAQNHIAVMISQSIDTSVAEPVEAVEATIFNSRNTSVRFCRFNDCKTAVVVGSDENISGLFGEHEISDNLFENCETGVKIKISGTQICGNIFRDCKTAIVNEFGAENEIFENRFENCEKAISVLCDDLTIKENCFVNSAVCLETKFDENALPILICENTFADAKIESCETMCFITKNIFYETEISENKNLVEKDNKIVEKDSFLDFTNGDFSTNTNYGSSNGAENRLKIEEIPLLDISEIYEKERGHSLDKKLPQEMIEERDLLLQSMYFQDENEEEIEFEAMSVGQLGLREIGIDGELEDN